MQHDAKTTPSLISASCRRVIVPLSAASLNIVVVDDKHALILSGQGSLLLTSFAPLKIPCKRSNKLRKKPFGICRSMIFFPTIMYSFDCAPFSQFVADAIPFTIAKIARG
jgi:hypothetical protein